MPDQLSLPSLTVRAIRATPVEVPPNFVLGTSQGAFLRVPLLLIDVDTEEGVTGRSYLFCYLRAAAGAIINLIDDMEELVEGEHVDPVALWEKLAARYALIGVQGIVRMAMAGFDVACGLRSTRCVTTALRRKAGNSSWSTPPVYSSV